MQADTAETSSQPKQQKGLHTTKGTSEFLVFVNLRIASLLHHMYVAWAHQCHFVGGTPTLTH